MAEIRYNNTNPFGNYPPLLSRVREQQKSAGGDLYYIDTFTLEGRLVVDTCDTFEEKYQSVRNLVISFSENFKKFEVIENLTTCYSYDHSIIESISFDKDKYINFIPYTIVIKCYSGNYAFDGILDPVDTYSYDDSDGCLVKITHTVSAKGINNSLDAISNVRNFIDSRKNYNPSYLPVGYTVSSPVLIEESESCNSITAEVSITRVYVYDKSGTASGYGHTNIFMKNSTEQSLDGGFFNFSVKGYIQGSLGLDMAGLRAGLDMIKSVSDTNASYYYNIYNPSGEIKLLGFSFSEEADTNKISFTINYSDSIEGDPYVVDRTSISISSKNRCVESSLTIKSNYGCVSEKLKKNKSYLESIDIKDYILDRWALYGDGGKLGNSLINKTIQIDNLTGDVSITASLCSDVLTNCSCIENLTYSLSGEEPLNKYSESLSYRGEGCAYIQDLNYKSRAKFGISGTFTKKKCCSEAVATNEAYTIVNLLMSKYFNATTIILESGNISKQSGQAFSFSFTWGGDKQVIL